jgi:hypothetical protein
MRRAMLIAFYAAGLLVLGFHAGQRYQAAHTSHVVRP